MKYQLMAWTIKNQKQTMNKHFLYLPFERNEWNVKSKINFIGITNWWIESSFKKNTFEIGELASVAAL